MRVLSNLEVAAVSGASSDNHSYTRAFWTSFVESSGSTVGIFCSPFIMAGMIGYGVLYGTYSAVSAVCSGVYQGATYMMGSSATNESVSE